MVADFSRPTRLPRVKMSASYDSGLGIRTASLLSQTSMGGTLVDWDRRRYRHCRAPTLAVIAASMPRRHEANMSPIDSQELRLLSTMSERQ